MEHESDSDLVKSACRSITKSVTRPNLSSSDQEEVQSIWFIWADLEEKLALGNGHPIDRIWDEILRESLRLNEGLPDLHPSLLGKYFISSLQRDPAQSTISILNRISVKFRPSTAFFKIAFPALTTPSTNKFCELSKLYTAWRAVCKTGGDRVEAVMVWAEWLMGHGKGRDAGLAVDVVRREVLDDEDSSGELWRGWKGLLDMRERIMEEGDGDLVMGDVPDGENLVSLDLEEDGGGNGQEEDEEEAEEEAEEEDSLMDHEEESEGNSVHRGEAS